MQEQKKKEKNVYIFAQPLHNSTAFHVWAVSTEPNCK